MKACVPIGALLLSAAVLFGQNVSNWGAESLPGLGSPIGRSFPADSGRVTGTVISVDGRPQRDVLVQVHDFSTHSIVTSAYTNQGGSFTFDMVPSGNYELIASRDTDTVRAEVRVNGSSEVVTLRLSTRDPNAPPAQSGIVSLSQLKAPQRVRDAYAKAEQAAVKGQTEEMVKYLQRALQICPDYAPALTLRAAYLLDQDKVTLALEDLQKAIHADSTFAQAHAFMAAALNRMNRFDEALLFAERASSLAPSSWEPHYEMAKSYFGKMDYEHALQQLTDAQSELAQDYAPLHLLRAQALLRLSNYADAINELRAFLKIAPNAPNAASVRDALGRLNAVLALGTELANDEQRRPE